MSWDWASFSSFSLGFDLSYNNNKKLNRVFNLLSVTPIIYNDLTLPNTPVHRGEGVRRHWHNWLLHWLVPWCWSPWEAAAKASLFPPIWCTRASSGARVKRAGSPKLPWKQIYLGMWKGREEWRKAPFSLCYI